jgi:hypothetical protein
MPHRQLLQKRMAQAPKSELWSRHAARDLAVAGGFLREWSQHRTGSIGSSAAVLGALISYSRPFTERADPSFNQDVRGRHCFLALAADLGADLRLHAKVLQVRDEIIALSDVVSVPAQRLNARRFKYPDPHFARLTGNLDGAEFRKLVAAMRAACDFFSRRDSGAPGLVTRCAARP